MEIIFSRMLQNTGVKSIVRTIEVCLANLLNLVNISTHISQFALTCVLTVCKIPSFKLFHFVSYFRNYCEQMFVERAYNRNKMQCNTYFYE